MITPADLPVLLSLLLHAPEVGQFALCAAIALAAIQTLAGLSPSPVARLAGVAQGGVLASLLLAFAALTLCFVVSDFSVMAVASYSHTDKPMIYKIAGVWGNHEGSMLLWSVILALFGMGLRRAAVDGRTRDLALALHGALQLTFLLFTLLASNPLARVLPVPLQGQSLNPLLQDPALALHPPLLYAGYVGFSAVFVLAMAGLITGRIDQVWARAARPLAQVAWLTLTCGIALGSYWAYYELGWGGWWFWDPVENASLLPWLAGTALLHALTITDRRGLFPGWAVFLALLTFALSLLGTFLVRSGVLTSVHAFALDPQRGYAVLAIFALFAGGGFALFAARGGQLRGADRRFVLASREGMMMVNNLVLATATFAVLIGTLYPLLLEGLSGRAISVGAPYFNAVFTPLMAVLLLALPFGLAAPWRQVPVTLWRHVLVPGLAGLAVFAGGVAVLGLGHAMTALGLALGAWVLLAAGVDFIRRSRGGVRAGALAVLLAHAGLGVMVLGAVTESALKSEVTALLTPGDDLRLGRHHVTLQEVGEVDGPNYIAARGILRLDGHPKPLMPERRFYPAANQSTTEAAIISRPWGDVYVTLSEPQSDAAGQMQWPVRLAWHPGLIWIYAGAVLMALGGCCALWGRRR